MLKKKIWPNFPRIIEVFTQKIVTKPSKIWVWDPGSGKNLFRIPDPGVKKAPDPGSGSATLLSIRPQELRYIIHYRAQVTLISGSYLPFSFMKKGLGSQDTRTLVQEWLCKNPT
jgi:hypothetical protein